jgi:hypothetical protein
MLEKRYLLKMRHVIDAAKKNFPFKKLFPHFAKTLFKKLKDSFLFNFFVLQNREPESDENILNCQTFFVTCPTTYPIKWVS